jgi:hypothetical protein
VNRFKNIRRGSWEKITPKQVRLENSYQEGWNFEILEYWNIGILKEWKNGRREDWIIDLPGFYGLCAEKPVRSDELR